MSMPSLYDASVPLFIRGLGNLSHVLKKGAAHAKAAGLDPKTLIEARLAPDMHPLPAQVQRASDTAKGCAMRLAGRAVPSFEDTEQSFEELEARIQKTIAVLKELSPSDLEGSERREIVLELPNRSLRFEASAYLLDFAIPNFFFHVTTGYAILRHKGVEIGKTDYLGKL
jgi:uncharacterized protein